MASIDKLIEELSRNATAVKPAPHPWLTSAKWVAWGLIYLAVMLLFSGLRPDWTAKLHEPLFAAEIMALALLFFTASIAASHLAFPDLHQERRATLSPLPAFLALLLILYFSFGADAPPAPLPRHSFECTISIMMAAILPAIMIFLWMRKFASTHQRLAGSSAMLAAFSIGALWLRLFEKNDSILHVILWHYLPMLAFCAAGAWLGKRALKW